MEFYTVIVILLRFQQISNGWKLMDFDIIKAIFTAFSNILEGDQIR
jgi:hypothetical protein